ncbi:LiaI-LiaF-like domain-containing protein [Candidatus Leptofilum sp.]|uniref:LiaI-LiaF-like domain-containing protein n=1 Tax=Candidatus Leptofilum sp. TaxID=3241576 RepID=UPI003B5A6572
MDDLQSRRRRKSGRSLFGPIFLIGVGAYFLLRNMGVVSDLNWGLAFQLWPLLLIFLGLNIIVQQVRRPFGTFLSGIVSLAAVGVFGAVLLFGVELPLLSRFNLQSAANYRQETVTVSAEGARSAEIFLDLGALGADVTDLESDQNLLEGNLSLVGELQFQESLQGSKANISLGERNLNFWNGGFAFGGQEPPWQIGLSRTVPIDLNVEMGSGASDLKLGSLNLEDFALDMGSGAANVQLPGGAFEINIEGGSGKLVMTLPPDGRHRIDIDGGSGAMDLFLPPNMEARVELDSGSGRVSLDDRFERISGDDRDGIWQTLNYEADSNNRLLIIIEGGSGSIAIRPQTGR